VKEKIVIFFGLARLDTSAKLYDHIEIQIFVDFGT
jgi:hypothetical protein